MVGTWQINFGVRIKEMRVDSCCYVSWDRNWHSTFFVCIYLEHHTANSDPSFEKNILRLEGLSFFLAKNRLLDPWPPLFLVGRNHGPQKDLGRQFLFGGE